MRVVYISGDYVYSECEKCEKCGYREIVHKDEKTIEINKIKFDFLKRE